MIELLGDSMAEIELLFQRLGVNLGSTCKLPKTDHSFLTVFLIITSSKWYHLYCNTDEPFGHSLYSSLWSNCSICTFDQDFKSDYAHAHLFIIISNRMHIPLCPNLDCENTHTKTCPVLTCKASTPTVYRTKRSASTGPWSNIILLTICDHRSNLQNTGFPLAGEKKIMPAQDNFAWVATKQHWIYFALDPIDYKLGLLPI